MASFMGIYIDNGKYVNQMPAQWLEPGVGGQRVNVANVYPKQPVLTNEEWEKIVEFYMKNAPEKLPSSPQRQIKVGIPFFKSKVFSNNKNAVPLIQSMTVDEDANLVYAAEYKGGVFKYNFKGKPLDYYSVQSHIVEMEASKDEIVLLNMATRYASDNPMGTFSIVNSFQDLKQKKFKTEIKQLMRPVDFAMGDLTGNNKNDFVLAEYGNLLGALSWFENKEDGNFQRHELFADDGSIKAEITDINKDGKNDIIALKGNRDIE